MNLNEIVLHFALDQLSVDKLTSTAQLLIQQGYESQSMLELLMDAPPDTGGNLKTISP